MLHRHLTCGLPFGIGKKCQIHRPQDPFLYILRCDLIGEPYLSLSTLHNRLRARPTQRSLQPRALPLHIDDE